MAESDAAWGARQVYGGVLPPSGSVPHPRVRPEAARVWTRRVHRAGSTWPSLRRALFEMAKSGDSELIDVPQATGEAEAWGIELREWMELRTHVFGNADAFGDFISEDSAEEEWRGRVAQVLIENGHAPKANRYIECCRYGVRIQCKGPDAHQLFSPVYCDLRYCPWCGPRQFARLIEKHSPAIKAVTRERKPGYL